MAGRMSKSDKLGAVDHSKIDYAPFRRNFYIEVQELQKMSEEEVAKYRKELDDIKVCHTALPRMVRSSHITTPPKQHSGRCRHWGVRRYSNARA